MPPINQQGSRAGLITTLVVFAILFITSSIFAFQFYGKYQTSEANYAAYKIRYAGVLPDGLLQSGPVVAVQAAKDEHPSKLGVMSTDSVVEALIHQRDGAIGIIRGAAPTSDNPGAVADEAANLIKDSKAKLTAAGLPVPLPATGLESVVTMLTTTAVAGQGQIASLTAQLNEAQNMLKAAQAAAAQAATASAQALDNQQKADAETLAKANADTAAVKGAYDGIQKDITANGNVVLTDKAASDAAVQVLNHQISDLDKQLAAYKLRLGSHRPKVEDAALRQSDGKLIRVASNGICYINLGEGDQVTPV